MQRAIEEVYGSVHMRFLRSCSLLEKALMVALMLEVRATKRAHATVQVRRHELDVCCCAAQAEGITLDQFREPAEALLTRLAGAAQQDGDAPRAAAARGEVLRERGGQHGIGAVSKGAAACVHPGMEAHSHEGRCADSEFLCTLVADLMSSQVQFKVEVTDVATALKEDARLAALHSQMSA